MSMFCGREEKWRAGEGVCECGGDLSAEESSPNEPYSHLCPECRKELNKVVKEMTGPTFPS